MALIAAEARPELSLTQQYPQEVHQEVADEDAFNGLEFGQDLLLNEAFKLHAEWIAAKADANARGPHRSHD